MVKSLSANASLAERGGDLPAKLTESQSNTPDAAHYGPNVTSGSNHPYSDQPTANLRHHLPSNSRGVPRAASLHASTANYNANLGPSWRTSYSRQPSHDGSPYDDQRSQSAPGFRPSPSLLFGSSARAPAHSAPSNYPSYSSYSNNPRQHQSSPSLYATFPPPPTDTARLERRASIGYTQGYVAHNPFGPPPKRNDDSGITDATTFDDIDVEPTPQIPQAPPLQQSQPYFPFSGRSQSLPHVPYPYPYTRESPIGRYQSTPSHGGYSSEGLIPAASYKPPTPSHSAPVTVRPSAPTAGGPPSSSELSYISAGSGYTRPYYAGREYRQSSVDGEIGYPYSTNIGSDGFHGPLTAITEDTEPSSPTTSIPPPLPPKSPSQQDDGSISERPQSVYVDEWRRDDYEDILYPPSDSNPATEAPQKSKSNNRFTHFLRVYGLLLSWILVCLAFWPVLLPHYLWKRRNAGATPTSANTANPFGIMSTSNTSSEPASTISEKLEYSMKDITKDVYNGLLLAMPSLYFSRVARIFEEADLSLAELKKMTLESASKMKAAQIEYFAMESQNMPPVYINLKHTWQNFIDSVMREWKTFNIISVLLLSAILTILQIDAAANDPLTRYTALASLVCALLSLLYGCMYIIRFGTMREPYKAAEWALEAKKSKTVFWNVWVLLAMPAVWLSWSLVLYIFCIMSFTWRTTAHDTGPSPIGDTALLAVRILITILLTLGIVYGVLIVVTFRRYGKIMDDAWKERINKWIQKKQQQMLSAPLPPVPHVYDDTPHRYSRHSVGSGAPHPPDYYYGPPARASYSTSTYQQAQSPESPSPPHVVSETLTQQRPPLYDRGPSPSVSDRKRSINAAVDSIQWCLSPDLGPGGELVVNIAPNDRTPSPAASPRIGTAEVPAANDSESHSSAAPIDRADSGTVPKVYLRRTGEIGHCNVLPLQNTADDKPPAHDTDHGRNKFIPRRHPQPSRPIHLRVSTKESSATNPTYEKNLTA